MRVLPSKTVVSNKKNVLKKDRNVVPNVGCKCINQTSLNAAFTTVLNAFGTRIVRHYWINIQFRYDQWEHNFPF